MPYVSQHEYFLLYGRHLPFERSKALQLSQYLHDLGVLLHFQNHPLLSRTVILQSAWTTEAVFRILDDERVKAAYGRFDERDCARLWADAAHADMHPELVALMERFELCYPLASSDPRTWLAPQLLPAEKPLLLVDHANVGDLVLRYRFHVPAEGRHQPAHGSTASVRPRSRIGVDQRRPVRARRDNSAGRTYAQWHRHRAAGAWQRANSAAERRRRRPGCAERLASGPPRPSGQADSCTCAVCRVAAAPHFFPHKEMLRRREHDKLKVECPVSFAQVDVLELIEGIRVDALPAWADASKGAPAKQRTVRIFLASSVELRDDRDAFELYFRQQNDYFRKKGLYLEIVRWESFLNAMSDRRLQDEYNDAVRSCDVFVALFLPGLVSSHAKSST